MKSLTIEAKSTTKLETLFKMITINLKGEVKFGYMGFAIGVKVINMHKAIFLLVNGS